MSQPGSRSVYERGKLYEIKVDDLQSDPSQPRKYFDAGSLDELANSTKIHGILQPILFREDATGRLFVVAGERRLQAARKAALPTVPAMYTEGKYAEIALAENLFRQDLTAIELAEALHSIMNDHGYKQEELTAIIGKAKSTVSEILSLNKLPDLIKDECRTDPAISRQVLIDIAKKKTKKGMQTLYDRYKARKLQQEKPNGRKKGRRTWQEKFDTKYNDFKAVLRAADPGKLDEAGQADLILLLEELKRTADELLSQVKTKTPSADRTIGPKTKERSRKSKKSIDEKQLLIF